MNKQEYDKGLRSVNLAHKSLKLILMYPVYITGYIIISGMFDLLLAWPLKWAWNYVMPHIFNLPIIGYWQMFLLSFILTSLWKIHIYTPSRK